ncbi:hypothetical protein [Dongia sp.]|uniref:hypothetical protein n=1 Tax=Dongia sp. TaxID=1977262 RepID=UPI0037521045
MVKDDLRLTDSKKYAQYKSELEEYLGKRKKLIEDYQAAYPNKLKRWQDHHGDLRRLWNDLSKIYPNWIDAVKGPICQRISEISGTEYLINTRKYRTKGIYERRLEASNAAAQLALDERKAWIAAPQQIDAALTAHDGLIKAIDDLVPGRQQGQAIYTFWFKLLPDHVRVGPERPGAEFPSFPPQDTGAAWLCPVQDDTVTTPPEDGAFPPKPTAPGKRAPWLVPPEDYGDKLDAAWIAYDAARQAAVAAEVEFKRQPDDTDTISARLKDLNKTLEQRIADALTGYGAAAAAVSQKGNGDHTAD